MKHIGLARQRPPTAGGKGNGGRDEHEKDKRHKPSLFAHNTAGATPSTEFADIEDTFPILRSIGKNRSLIPVLICASLVFGFLIIGLLLRQGNTNHLEMPVSSARWTPSARPKDNGRIVDFSHDESSTKIELQEPPAVVEKRSKITKGTPAPPFNADSSQSQSQQSGGHDPQHGPVAVDSTTAEPLSSPTTVESVPPISTTKVARKLRQLRGIIDVPAPRNWTESNDTLLQRTVIKAFPVARGVYLLTSAVLHGPSPTSPSRFACLCLDNSDEAANSNRDVILKAVKLITAETIEASHASETDAPSTPLESASEQVTFSLPNASIFQQEYRQGRHRVMLADGKILETRVKSCAGRFFSSTHLALCDPAMSLDDTADESAAPTTQPLNITKNGKPQRPPQKPAMIPVQSCANADLEMAREVLTKRLYNPTSLRTRLAFLAAFSVNESAYSKRMLLSSPEAPPKTNPPHHASYSWLEDYVLNAGMCGQCGGGGDSDPAETSPRHQLHDSKRFQQVLFERSQNQKLLQSLNRVAKTQWQAVRRLLRTSDLESTQTEDRVKSQEMLTQEVEDVRRGAAALNAFAGRCNKGIRVDHFAQCFTRNGTSALIKSGNWSVSARDRAFSNRKLRILPSRFFSKTLSHQFPIPSQLSLHPLNSAGHIVCYASGDLVCDIVGKSGGWETELVHIVAFAAHELRKMVMQAATILKQRLEPTATLLTANVTNAAKDDHNATNVTVVNRTATNSNMSHMEAFLKKYRVAGIDEEFSVSVDVEQNEQVSALLYHREDVTFVDVGGNVGVFAVSMWRKGFRTEVFEALPQNVFLLESARCTNRADIYAKWEEQRSQVLSKKLVAAEAAFTRQWQEKHANKVSKAPNSTARVHELSTSSIRTLLELNREELMETAKASLPPYFQDDAANSSLQGPIAPDFEVHHVALGNGKRGRMGDEVLPYELNTTQTSATNDVEIAANLVAAAKRADDAEDAAPDATQMCVMISERDNFGDIVILCNESLVEEARAAIARVGPTNARVLEVYVPRGFVQLKSLDRVLDATNNTTDTAIDFQNHIMRQRFASLFATNMSSHVAGAPIVVTNHSKPNLTRVANETIPVPRRVEISKASTTEELRNFVAFSQLVMKVDVEGNEEYVLQGASDLLSDPLRRPKLILSEVWRKTHIARYGAYMIGLHGYVGLALADKIWLRSVVDVVRYHRSMPREMDSIVWVVPGFEHLIPASAFRRSL